MKVIDLDKNQGDLAFWQRATSLRMHQLDGYALLGEVDLKSGNGVPGHELRFGHDENGKPYVYTLRVFLTHKGWPSTGSRLFLVAAKMPLLVRRATPAGRRGERAGAARGERCQATDRVRPSRR